jgi:hypothetical protein
MLDPYLNRNKFRRNQRVRFTEEAVRENVHEGILSDEKARDVMIVSDVTDPRALHEHLTGHTGQWLQTCNNYTEWIDSYWFESAEEELGPEQSLVMQIDHAYDRLIRRGY